MKNWYIGFVLCGHRFRCPGGQEYIAISSAEKTDESIAVVKAEDYGRWKLLCAWRRNKVHIDTPEWDADDKERAGYETVIPCTMLEPVDKIRFITPDYNDKFRVVSGDMIMLNGEPRYTVFIDETHMYIGKPGGYWNCYHICEFAELCEKHGAVIAPVQA